MTESFQNLEARHWIGGAWAQSNGASKRFSYRIARDVYEEIGAL